MSEPVFTGQHPAPARLPGEPERPELGGLRGWVRLVLRWLRLGVTAALVLPLWPLYLVLAAVYGRPPNLPRWSQIGRYLRAACTVSPPPPGLPWLHRLWLITSVLMRVATRPLTGLLWLVDEVLYARTLDAMQLSAPLFEISAGRSGSTQLAHYLEDDPHLLAPTLLQSLVPYLWVWRLAAATVGRWVHRDTVRRRVEGLLPPEFLERHELDPFRTDTFDVAFFGAHLNMMSIFFGPAFAAQEGGMGVAAPHNRGMWEEDFPALLERIGRKAMVFAGSDGRDRRLFVKGHFLAGAEALARRFPDGRFLTLVRAPGPRFQSGINYMRANPLDPVLGPPRWGWLAEAAVQTEIAYCEQELAWFTAPQGPRRCVVRFVDYVRDLSGTMERIYAECLDRPVPDHTPRVHPPRRRHSYLLDRSLEQLGVNSTALHTRLADYVRWCGG